MQPSVLHVFSHEKLSPERFPVVKIYTEETVPLVKFMLAATAKGSQIFPLVKTILR